MIYKNPIIYQDFSDPDVIRQDDNYYLIASSFNHTPGIPVLESKNLVDWQYCGYIFDKLPFDKFDNVCHGEGAWAPSLRYHDGRYYAMIPMPDEGIFVSSCTDIKKGDWTSLHCLLKGKGYEDPCPIWHNGKCYVVFAFVYSRIGFNSKLALMEVTPDLRAPLEDYKIIYDGKNAEPTIEGPKLYFHNDYFYIMAPAGSVRTGWQAVLRSKNIYGPYEDKIVLTQGDTKINGPHQGALIDLEDDKWAFIHFQQKGSYGRIIHLEPVTWTDDWPIPGNIKYEGYNGVPFLEHEYLINKKSNYKIPLSDDFKGEELSFIWQTPANKREGFYALDNGLRLNCYYHNEEALKALNMAPNLFLTKIGAQAFRVSVNVKLSLKNDLDEAGLVYMGEEYAYISIRRINNESYIVLAKGKFKNDDEIITKIPFDKNEIEFNLKFYTNETYQLGFNNNLLDYKFKAMPGRWIGGKYGLFARGNKSSKGYALFNDFKVRRNK